MKRQKPFIDFYGKMDVIPTNQDITDLGTHFQRRGSLYCQLGIPPLFVQGRSVIEFGPGSGHNAIFTASLKPRNYTLVDANKKSLEGTRKVLRQHARGVSIKIVASEIQKFTDKARFDLVLCEGVIPTQFKPASFLKHVAGFSKPGGVTVMTCMDSASVLSEVLRRYQAFFEAGPAHPMDQRVARLTRFFKSHLEQLPGMSRRHEDWVIDAIIHPWSGPLFSITEALAALEGSYTVLGSSPKILEDWRWYKQIVREKVACAKAAHDSYWDNVHSFIDYRQILPPRPRAKNVLLLAATDHIYRSVLDFELGKIKYPPEQLAKDLRKVVQLLAAPSSDATHSLEDFIRGLNTFKKTGQWGKLPKFSSMWGRGQQYLSFIRL